MIKAPLLKERDWGDYLAALPYLCLSYELDHSHDRH